MMLRHTAVWSHLDVAEIAGVKSGPKGCEVGHKTPQFEILQMQTRRSRKYMGR